MIERSDSFFAGLEVQEWWDVLLVKGKVKIQETCDLFEGVDVIRIDEMCPDHYFLFLTVEYESRVVDGLDVEEWEELFSNFSISLFHKSVDN